MDGNEQDKAAPEEAPSKGAIEMTGSVLHVRVDLNQPNGMIVAFGMLEAAKRAVDTWEIRRQAQKITVPNNGKMSFADRFRRGFRG